MTFLILSRFLTGIWPQPQEKLHTAGKEKFLRCLVSKELPFSVPHCKQVFLPNSSHEPDKSHFTLLGHYSKVMSDWWQLLPGNTDSNYSATLPNPSGAFLFSLCKAHKSAALNLQL